jgi:hypothetical protein
MHNRFYLLFTKPRRLHTSQRSLKATSQLVFYKTRRVEQRIKNSNLSHRNIYFLNLQTRGQSTSETSCVHIQGFLYLTNTVCHFLLVHKPCKTHPLSYRPYARWDSGEKWPATLATESNCPYITHNGHG